MCEFCHRHGEGKKWYLQAKNYSQDLLGDVRRRKMIRGFFSGEGAASGERSWAQKLDRLPKFVQRAIKGRVSRRMKQMHFGQVLPLEDVETIFGFVDSIVRVPCICRHATLGREVRYCYGVTLGPGGGMGELLEGLDSSFLSKPDLAGQDKLTPEQALRAFVEHEREGLCHTVWTFVTPFIGGVCNCDRADCLAMKASLMQGVKVMFRGEAVAEANPDLCTGCRACMRLCQFGALGYSAANQKAFVDQTACYGCGLCRSACQQGALRLRPRAEVPAAKALW
jgi:ferredoxin